ncbi:MAG: hypothetical protein R3B45_02870 [Bdellovibrionota bacterium]
MQPLLGGSGLDVDPTFSPNGKWLAFVSGRFGNPHIFRASLEWNQDHTSVRVLNDKGSHMLAGIMQHRHGRQTLKK